MKVLGRRAFLTGSALIGCSSSTTNNRSSFASTSDGKDHWTTRFFGRPPIAMLAMRFVAPKPDRLSVLFRGWRPPGIDTDPLPFERPVLPFGYAALKQCPDAEFFADTGGEMLAVLRGVPPGVDPFVPRCRQGQGNLCFSRSPDFKVIGTSASGVMQAAIVDGRWGSSDGRLFRLPDGTWALAKGLPALRLADALAKDPRLPPSERLEPSAPVAQLYTFTDGETLMEGRLAAADKITAMTSVVHGAPAGAPVPVAWRLHTGRGDTASTVAEDLGRIFARARQQGAIDAQQFPVTSSIAVDGTSVVLRGTLPFKQVAEWAR